MEGVAGVEEYEVAAAGSGEAFVHGVVKAAVGLGEDGGFVGGVASGNGEGVIFRCAVDDQVFIVAACLGGHALHCGRQGRGGVVGDGYYGKKGSHQRVGIL